MPPAAELCEACAHIPFDDLGRGDSDCETWLYNLGPLSDLQDRQCPVCHLVNKAVLWSQRTDSRSRTTALRKHREVKLRWQREAVPGFRPAFTVLTDSGRGTYLAFGTPTAPGEHAREFETSYLRPELPAQVDIGRISRWIDNCATRHHCVVSPSLLDFSTTFPGLNVLRLIDVVQDRLVEKRDPVQYVALSYVWGAVSNFRLTKANRARLMLTGALQDVFAHLPMTIRNAITLVQMLNLRYLWVDSLCLLQNDVEDLELGVGVMDQIYEHAWVTIIAAHGHDADAGLPGIQMDHREKRPLLRKIKEGTYLGLIKDPDIRLKRTVYETRAWTFQENILSRRKLYFFEDEVTFWCRRCECLESCRDDTDPKMREYNDSSLLWYSLEIKYPLVDYETILFNYTARTLTNQSDVLRAMAGIMRRFSSKFRYRMLEGLPTGAFDYFILFSGTRIRRRRGFPSYSWAGWIGRVDINVRTSYNHNVWLQDRTWIIWYKRSPRGVLNLVWDPEANPSFPLSDLDMEGYRRRTRFQYPTAGSNLNTSRIAPPEEPPALAKAPSYTILQFYTMVVFLKLGALDVFDPQAGLIGRDGKSYGRVILDGFEETTFFESENLLEIILLSESDGFDGLQGCERCEVPWGFYSVMVLEWHQGLAERRGIGALKKEAIHQSFPPGPLWKQIVLG